jgi:hypothetical protein
MSFIWFTIKVYVFDLLYSGVIAFALMPLMMLAVATTPKAAQSPGVESSESGQRNPLVTAVTLLLLIALCSAQGVIVAAAVKLSLTARPDAWWPLWYLIGFGASLPAALSSNRSGSAEAEFGKLVGFLSATGGYIAVCIWPTIVPKLLLRVSMVVAV